MNHNPHELDRASPHTELNCTKPSILHADLNVVVIHIPVYVGVAETFPVAAAPAPVPVLPINRWRHCRQKHDYSARKERLFANSHHILQTR
jgi:hypothetical protein